jgi:type I restriction enzyme S subunit
VIGRATNLGQPTWSSGDFWPLNTTLYVADFKGNLPRWVFHLFESIDVSGFDSGSVQPMLNRNYIAQVPVLVPPVPEQRAIAEVLGALDDKIVANGKVGDAAEGLALAIASRFEPSVPLSAIVDLSRTTVTPSSLDVDAVDHYSLPAFDAGRLPDRIAPAEILSNKFLVDRPSLLVSKLNPRFPRVWDVAPTPDVPAVASTEFVVLHPIESATTFLWSVVAQPRFGAVLEAMVAGTSGSHQRVKPTDILGTLVPDPVHVPVAVHLQIQALGLRAESTRAENRRLAATRDALLPALMSGEFRVRDAERVVADSL